MLTIHETYGEFLAEEAENDPNYKGCLFTTITAPLYWWRELEEHGPMVYFVHMTSDFMTRDFQLSDFSHEQLDLSYPRENLDCTIHTLNSLRNAYLQTGEPSYSQQIFKLLPLSYNDTRIVQFDYSLLLDIYSQHFDDEFFSEWDTLCNWIREILRLTPTKEDFKAVKDFVREKL